MFINNRVPMLLVIVSLAAALLLGAVGCDDDWQEFLEDFDLNDAIETIFGGWGRCRSCSPCYSCGSRWVVEEYFDEWWW